MKKFQYGGQAVMEGVMMRGKDSTTISVRKPTGDIVVSERKNNKSGNKPAFHNWPIIRGVINFVASMVVGIESLMYSANQVTDEEEEKLSATEISLTLVVSLVLFIGIFIVLPNLVVAFLTKNVASAVVVNLIEGLLRITIFLIYLFAMSKVKDIQRVFQYHGAEHKSIAAWEAGEELTVENARKYTRFHPRCGTNFLLIVMVVSILMFSLLGKQTIFMRLLTRILLLPVVAGVSYEVLKFAGAHSSNKIVACAIWPGLMLQKLTTGEPDDSQLEVALVSLRSVIANDKAFEEDENTVSLGEKIVRFENGELVEVVEAAEAVGIVEEVGVDEIAEETPEVSDTQEQPID